MKPLTNAEAMRRLCAAQEWGPINRTYRERDLRFYSCAGHAGLFAPVPGSLPVRLRDELRVRGMIQRIVTAPSGGRRRSFSSFAYGWGTLEDWVGANRQNVLSDHQFLVGEGDCAWAVVALTIDAFGGRYESMPGIVGDWRKTAEDTARVWYPEITITKEA